MSLLFAALLAASFAIVPGHPPEAPQATQRAASPAATQAKAGGKAGAPNKGATTEESSTQQRAVRLISDFAGNGLSVTAPPYRILFATVADPVQTHLAAAFDHDVAAVQDAAQDSGYLFDSSWIPWLMPQGYDAYDDQQKADRARNERYNYPGILLFRSAGYPGQGAYEHGMIVFLVAEKPTAGINITQAQNALTILASAAGATKAKPLVLAEPVLVAGPSYSGSFDSLELLVNAFRNTHGIRPPGKFLIRSDGFTSAKEAETTADGIARKFQVDVDMGSAFHPFEDWTRLALDTLDSSGIHRNRVAILSEGESLFGQSVETETVIKKESGSQQEAEEPWSLQFPRDISALRSSYEKQGLLEAPSNSDSIRRALHLNSEDAHSGDSIRMYGGDATVAAQESVLFGISEFIRSHGIHAAIIVATNEEDGYFLTRFVHAHNSGVRVVVIDATRLFMRGATAQFRGDMMVSSFPMLPRLHDWTTVAPPAAGSTNTPKQDPSYYLFPNDSSEGAFMAVRDLLWGPKSSGLPHEYSVPDWKAGDTVDFRPPVYIAALGSGAAWPVADLHDQSTMICEEGTAQGPQKCTAQPQADARKGDQASPWKWRLSMPFAFADHPGRDESPNAHPGPLRIHASAFWQLMFWICVAIPISYSAGMLMADPVRRREFAYLQPAAHWQQWIMLLTVPALLTEASFLVMAQQMIVLSNFAPTLDRWRTWTLVASLVSPLLMTVIAFGKAFRAKCFAKGNSDFEPTPAFFVFAFSVVAFVAIFFAFEHGNGGTELTLSQFLYVYREMHWESGLSLLPTIELTILAASIWNYEALIGISVLHTRPKLPDFATDERISDEAGDRIAKTGHPIPLGRGTLFYWVGVALAGVGTTIALWLWPSFAAISSLSSDHVTHLVFVCAGIAGLLMVMDLMQFAWVWAELRDLLLVLNHQRFKRSFIPLRDFNWSSIWTFSGGSLKDMRKVLAAEIQCAFDIHAEDSALVTADDLEFLHRIRANYGRLDIQGDLPEYRTDFTKVQDCMALIGSRIANVYPSLLKKVPAPSCGAAGPTNDDAFRDEERELEQLPAWLCLYERFLCLLYVGFLRVMIARLRTLAISVVLVFSLVALGLAVYPFEPNLPLFVVGVIALAAVAAVMFVVFSQMDKDPVLARILQSNPNKLEWSFYGKFIDALALPLLTLLSTLLPGGAGRLIDLLRTAFSHAQ